MFTATQDLSGSKYLPVTQWYYTFQYLVAHLNAFRTAETDETMQNGIDSMLKVFLNTCRSLPIPP